MPVVRHAKTYPIRVNDLNSVNISPSERVNTVDMLDTVNILSTNQANATNTFDMGIDSIMTDVSSREALFTDGSPTKPLSDEPFHFSSAFPSSPLDLQLGTSQLGSQPIYPPGVHAEFLFVWLLQPRQYQRGRAHRHGRLVGRAAGAVPNPEVRRDTPGGQRQMPACWTSCAARSRRTFELTGSGSR